MTQPAYLLLERRGRCKGGLHTRQRMILWKAAILRCAVLVPEWVKDLVKSHHLHLLSAASVLERLESVFHWAPVLEAWDLGA